MITYGIGFALLAFAFLALALQRLYSSIPSRELKRLAGRGDSLAKRLYRVAAYGASLRLFLWTILGITLPISFLLLIPSLPMIAGFVLLAVSSAVLFVWLPSLRLTVHTAQFATWFVSPIAWVLSRTHGLFEIVANGISTRRELVPHSRLYEKEDLQWLLDLQKDQVDNRIDPQELDLVQRAMAFTERQAADIVQPRKEAHLVNADDAIGPVLLDTLHKSHHNSFLVYKDNEENIVGSLSMADAVKAKHGGRVFDLVRSDLVFVHEDFTLREVLIAFQKTGHQVAVVVNSFEEFIGIINFDRLVNELLGEARTSTDLMYENRSAVAAYKPKPQIEEKQSDENTTATLELSDQSVDVTTSTESNDAVPADSAGNSE
ncbi:MAG: CBS domain-containing protein [Candidatus Saccharimonadales bacterium]